ncbi:MULTISPECIES: hypothetical protein [unclassified Methanoculleus]|uniref:Uncharacterized protein n=1 Tax=Methanoculleus palmolei TaxID=72612 RepID=A0ABD8A801_9EURY|nr:hypothetical protein [Methanoculleus sp. UBA377]MDD2473420.1 hypothetical protein [Methanoculleus sp.]WOX55651.1 hypothetical protein R6Y95_09280 [Methanoculleus palmolei]
MIPNPLRGRVLKIEPDALYMGKPYGAWVTVEMQDGAGLELFNDYRDSPLSLLWKKAAIEISGGISKVVERVPEQVQRVLPGSSSSLEVWGVIVMSWTARHGTYERRHGLVDFGTGTIEVDLSKKDPAEFREGDYVYVRTARTDLKEIHELDRGPNASLPDTDTKDASGEETVTPFTLEFFIDEDISVQRYRADPSRERSWWNQLWQDVESAPWRAWLNQRGSFSLKIGENYTFPGEAGSHGPHFREASLPSLLGVFTQSGLELLDGETVVIRPCSSSGPRLVLEPCSRDLLKISALESDTVVIPAMAVRTEDYMKAVIDTVDRYLRQALEVHPHLSRTPYPRILADRRNELMRCCRRRDVRPGDGQLLDYDALVDCAWRAYRRFLSPPPEGGVSRISFGVTLLEGETPERPLFRFSPSVDGQVLFEGIDCDSPLVATLFVVGLFFSIKNYLEGKAYVFDLTTPGPRTIILAPGDGDTVLFSLDNIYEPGMDARKIVLRSEDWVETAFATADTYIALVGASPLWVEDSCIDYALLPLIEEVREKLRQLNGSRARQQHGIR